MRPFSTRTLLLMVLALLAFARLWCVTHPSQEAPRAATPVELLPVGGDR